MRGQRVEGRSFSRICVNPCHSRKTFGLSSKISGAHRDAATWNSKHAGGAFFQNSHAVGEVFFLGDLEQPARGFVHFFEGEFEGAVVHRDEKFRAEVLERFHRLVGAHVHFAEGVRVIRADRQQGDFGRDAAADFFEAVEVGAVAGVIDAAALVFQNESAVAAVLVAQGAGAPMFAGREGDGPVVVRETFPPFEFNDALEAEVQREVADAPGHDADFRMRQSANGWFVKMIEVRVREQDEVNRRQVLDFQAGAFDAFEKEKPVGEIRVDEDVQVGELHEERGVPDPGDGDFASFQFGEDGPLMFPGAPREQGLPNHLVEEGARVEMFGGGEVFERLGQRLFRFLFRSWSWHSFSAANTLTIFFRASLSRGPTGCSSGAVPSQDYC